MEILYNNDKLFVNAVQGFEDWYVVVRSDMRLKTVSILVTNYQHLATSLPVWRFYITMTSYL